MTQDCQAKIKIKLTLGVGSTNETMTIWENGQLSYWDNSTTGAFEVKSCATGVTTIFLNPDSTFTLPDTIIDNTITPPDTTITPADTTITGDTYLLVNCDAQGHYELIIKLLNKHSAVDFKNGNLYLYASEYSEWLLRYVLLTISLWCQALQLCLFFYRYE